jgi:uncharacterized protein YdhG (YjbR/CyaY superfamily)
MDNNTSPKTISEYIAQAPAAVQPLLEQMRATIHAAAPEATEKISYAMPTFALYGNLVHFAALKNHIGFYPTPSGIEKFQTELEGYISTKGAVQFPLNSPLPLDLVARITTFRAAENTARAAAKAKKK